MRTVFVYALVSSPDDFYLEQAFVSMYSLKHHMPEAYIILVTDSMTESSFDGCRKKELQYADEIVVIPLAASFSKRQRSRLVKTSTRQHVTGDYLYIDCDTVICRPFAALDALSCDIAACVDSHCQDFHDNPYRWFGLLDGRKLDWPVDEESQYFNSGVLFVRDTPVAHEFFRRWHENYMDGFLKGVSMDQPSFAKTNYQMGHVVQVLDDVWNCELKHGLRYLKDAYIVHYLTTNTSSDAGSQVFRLNEPDLFNEMKETGIIPAEIEVIADDPFKGLAPLTHLFAGSDLYFLQSKPYKAITTSGIDYKRCLTSPEPERDFVQSPLFFYLLKHYPKGVAGRLNRWYCRLGAFRKKLGI